MRLTLHSEPRPPTGGIGATGALNSLGRPDLDFWPLYVREGLQNSWDAADPDRDGPVQVTFSVRHLTPAQRRVLTDEVFVDIPPDGSDDRWRQLTAPTVVTVSDTATKGMGGPTRADIEDPSIHDFADFVWNVGQPPDNDLGGGTYGYGKSVHYLASRCRTVLVHTRCRVPTGHETRLIVSAWGEEFAARMEGRAVAHTGRHWWGQSPDDPELPIAPITGADADRLAVTLGLPDLGDGGTTVMAFAADVSDPSEWGRTVADAVAWHCWPKLVDLGDGPAMVVRVTVDDESVPVADPTIHPELSNLVACLRDALGHTEPSQRVPIELLKPATRTGWLTFRRHMDRAADETTPARPFDGPMRHVALMRAPRLVVKYMQGPEPPAPFAGWGGVFVANDEHDRAFAQAEPPAHDDWVPKAVEDKAMRRIVNVSLSRIRDAMRDFVAPRLVRAEGDGHGLGALADELGDLLAGGGPGAVEPPRPASRASSSRRSTTASVTNHRLEATDDGLVLVVDVDVALGDRVDRGVLSMQVDVASGDGAGVEREAPEGALVPKLLGWNDPAGTWHTGPSVTIPRDQLDGWQAWVTVPRDTAVVLRPHCQEPTDV